jgi:16S rRNA (guanine966-N2)-methyltransferase
LGWWVWVRGEEGRKKKEGRRKKEERREARHSDRSPLKIVRIIAGSLKGRRLASPAWDGLRPTSDKLRETLFNVLGGRVAGAIFLDGYAGTGAIGLEAISRGAAHVTFIERDPRAIRLIRENAARCGVGEGYTILRAALPAALTRSAAAYDLIVLDPPYEEPTVDRVVDAAFDHLAEGGMLVLEHAARTSPPVRQGIAPSRILRSGDSALAFYER